jgi:P-type E1-E2 ATPase
LPLFTNCREQSWNRKPDFREDDLSAIERIKGPVLEVERTPLQRRLNQVGKALVLAALVIVGVVFVLGLLRGEDLQLLFLTAVSLAVAAVPEGLPAVTPGSYQRLVPA